MFTKILVAIDHSATSHAIFEAGLNLAQTHHAKLMLVHVLSAEEEGSPLPMPNGIDSIYWSTGNELDLEAWRQQWSQYEQDCLKELQALAAQANTHGVSTEFRQIPGSPGRSLCRMAHQWQADLIVIGNRGRTGISELFLGSVSNYVLHHAQCNVLTIKILNA